MKKTMWISIVCIRLMLLLFAVHIHDLKHSIFAVASLMIHLLAYFYRIVKCELFIRFDIPMKTTFNVVLHEDTTPFHHYLMANGQVVLLSMIFCHSMANQRHENR